MINTLWEKLELDKVYPDIELEKEREEIICKEYVNKLDLINNFIEKSGDKIIVNDLHIIKYKIELLRKQLKDKNRNIEFKSYMTNIVNNLKINLLNTRLKYRNTEE